jgi:tetratricopeptide (TPR) repeat protein
VIGIACLATIRSNAQQPPTTVELLDRYAKGEFADVLARVASLEKLTNLVKDLKRDDVKAWLDAGGPADRNRRELAAATFALEAARGDEWHEWKSIVNNPIGPPNVYWMPPPILIEWGCELLRKHQEPLPNERTWQLAAMSVGQRAEDTQFLIAFTELAPDAALPPVGAAAPPAGGAPPLPMPPAAPSPALQSFDDEVANVNKQIGHLNHVMERFPAEKRFVLAQALTRERADPNDAIKLYQTILDDLDVGPEASVRLGALLVRARRSDLSAAIQQFDRAEQSTRDPDLIYLARFYRGQALLQAKREDDAIAAFRAALFARPASQSASTALAALLVKAERYTEAQAVMKALLDARPGRTDPNIEYVHGDDRFWPYWLEKLHAEIKK